MEWNRLHWKFFIRDIFPFRNKYRLVYIYIFDIYANLGSVLKEKQQLKNTYNYLKYEFKKVNWEIL